MKSKQLRTSDRLYCEENAKILEYFETCLFTKETELEKTENGGRKRSEAFRWTFGTLKVLSITILFKGF